MKNPLYVTVESTMWFIIKNITQNVVRYLASEGCITLLCMERFANINMCTMCVMHFARLNCSYGNIVKAIKELLARGRAFIEEEKGWRKNTIAFSVSYLTELPSRVMLHSYNMNAPSLAGIYLSSFCWRSPSAK